MSMFVVRNADASIAFFAEKANDLVLAPGQVIEELQMSFAEYANRLVLSVEGVSGQTVSFPAGQGEIIVQVSCTPSPVGGGEVVDLLVNDLVETVPLSGGGGGRGEGTLILSRQTPGVFLIAPANRQLYPAAGSSLLAVVVEETPSPQ
ncbi:MAG: hypothetical protein IT308_09450 [Anaerolineaceae bacterium]|nr:hypothetical protein [Anaerolineaceae bacterium]